MPLKRGHALEHTLPFALSGGLSKWPRGSQNPSSNCVCQGLKREDLSLPSFSADMPKFVKRIANLRTAYSLMWSFCQTGLLGYQVPSPRLRALLKPEPEAYVDCKPDMFPIEILQLEEAAGLPDTPHVTLTTWHWDKDPRDMAVVQVGLDGAYNAHSPAHPEIPQTLYMYK